MVQSKVVLRSFAELAQLLDDLPPIEETGTASQAAVAEATADESALPEAPEAAAPAVDLRTLLAELQAASAALMSATERDREARTAALSHLEAYDALAGRQRNAEGVLQRAQQVRRDAEMLAVAAFAEDARAAATAVAQSVAQAEAGADRLVAEFQQEAEVLLAEPVLQRLLEERRQAEARKDAEATEAGRTRRLQEGLAAVRDALAAGRLPGAEAMLGPLAKEHPDSADITSLHESIRRRAQAVKSSVADEALRDARRAYRHAPAEAVARLEGLDLRDLPPELLHQVKGVWAAACARLCQARGVGAPLFRYLPTPAHGLVVAREQEGCYRVVSALGTQNWSSGSPVPEPFLRHARPLRASDH